eukprot:gnl/TRDRNA2_/TRDRNA2_136847_c0_seq1.p1 gnl/TRDRNA2_/TRDRNA2_136847_c0~~gnl/TRDRNA2_/TRDRNA2_136847_c0_seq1.p1  ORF type:complete len:664 (+),score=64.14 gnl/TRDRNA2_/TRDRNA2_136847_c0_seq1:121-1992(+)
MSMNATSPSVLTCTHLHSLPGPAILDAAKHALGNEKMEVEKSYANDIVYSSDGALYAVGGIVSLQHQQELFIVRTDLDMNVSWSIYMPVGSEDELYGVAVDEHVGNFSHDMAPGGCSSGRAIYVVGRMSGNHMWSGHASFGHSDAFVAKFRPSRSKLTPASPLWYAYLGGPLADGALAVASKGEAVYVVGYGAEMSSGPASNETVKWGSRRLSSHGSSNSSSAGNATFANGSSTAAGAVAFSFIARYDAHNSGATILPESHGLGEQTPLWTTKILSALVTGVAVADDGAVYVAGQTNVKHLTDDAGNALSQEENKFTTDCFLAKYSPQGNATWLVFIASTVGSAPAFLSEKKPVAVASDGSIFVVGDTEGNIAGQRISGKRDTFVARFRPDGALLSVRLVGTSLEEKSHGVVATAVNTANESSGAGDGSGVFVLAEHGAGAHTGSFSVTKLSNLGDLEATEHIRSDPGEYEYWNTLTTSTGYGSNGDVHAVHGTGFMLRNIGGKQKTLASLGTKPAPKFAEPCSSSLILPDGSAATVPRCYSVSSGRRYASWSPHSTSGGWYVMPNGGIAPDVATPAPVHSNASANTTPGVANVTSSSANDSSNGTVTGRRLVVIPEDDELYQ